MYITVRTCAILASLWCQKWKYRTSRSLGRTIPHYRTNYRRIKYGKYIERREFRALPDIINRDIICRGRCPRVNANYNPAHIPFFGFFRRSFDSVSLSPIAFGLPLLSRSNEQLGRSRQKLRSRARSQIFISCINVLPRGLLIIRAIDTYCNSLTSFEVCTILVTWESSSVCNSICRRHSIK